VGEKLYTKKGWRVEFDTGACTLCEICVNRCATHALSLRREDSKLEIFFDHNLCNGCLGQTLCQTDCPEDAVTVTRAPLEELPEGPISLVVGDMATCKECGNQFTPERKLATLLDQKKITPKSVQNYCPACRRSHLMDSYLNITGQTGARPVTSESEPNE
jgi:ferredoxin